MHQWLRRLRGLVSFGAVGAIAGGLFGGLYALGASVFGYFNLFGTLHSSVVFLALFGGASSFAVGMSLPILARSNRVSEISPVFPGIFGLLAGGVAPLALLAMIRGTVWGSGMGLVVGITGILGGAITGGMVALAGRAERRELEVGSISSEGLIESGEHLGSIAR